MNIWTDNLFYLVFLGQILLISYFVPRRIRTRAGRALETCTPETRPDLYPEPLSAYRTHLSIFKWSNRAIIVVGLVLLVIVYRLHGHGNHGNIPDLLPAIYGLLQFLPAIVMQILYARTNRRLREISPIKQRKAELRPRRLFGAVSPALFILALALMIAALLSDLYFHGFAINGKTLPRGITVLVTNGLLALVGWWKLYGRNRTPHRDPAKRDRNIGAQLTILLLCSIAYSVYLLFQSFAHAVGQHELDAIVMSLYFQFIMAMSIGFSLRATTSARQFCA